MKLKMLPLAISAVLMAGCASQSPTPSPAKPAVNEPAQAAAQQQTQNQAPEAVTLKRKIVRGAWLGRSVKWLCE